jgi:hypothetical protein
MPAYLLKPVKNVGDGGNETLYKLIQVEDDLIKEGHQKIQPSLSEKTVDKQKVSVLIEGKERTPLKVLLRKSDDFGRFSLGKGDDRVRGKNLLIIVLEPIDPNDRIFMEPIK